MAKPTAPIEFAGSKTMFAVDATAGTPLAYGSAAVETAPTSESTYPASWWGFATHQQGDTLTTPGGFATDGAGPVMLAAGLDGTTVRALNVGSTGNLQVDIITGGGGGGSADVQYLEGTADSSITGTAIMWEDATDILRPVSVAKPLPVAVQGTVPISGTVAATQSGTWNIGTLSTITNVVHVDDNASSLTVDGTVAATQSGTWNITNISGTVSLPTGAATSANQTTEITALQLIDDPVATSGSAAVTKLFQVGGTDGTNARIFSTDTSGRLNTNINGTVTITGITRTEYVEDAAAPANPTATALVARNRVFNAGAPTINNSEGIATADWVALNADASGSLYACPTFEGLPAGTTGAYSDSSGVGTSASLLSTILVGGEGALTGNVRNIPVRDHAVDLGGFRYLPANPTSSAGLPAAVLNAAPTTEYGLVTRNIPSGTQPVSGTVAATQSGTWNVGTVTTITNVVHVDDNSGSLTVDNNGTFAVQISGTTTVSDPQLCNSTTLATVVSVGTSATLLPATALTSRKRLIIQNTGTDTIYIGGSGVTTSTGIRLYADGDMELDEHGPSNLIYAIVASGTQNVRVLERS